MVNLDLATTTDLQTAIADVQKQIDALTVRIVALETKVAAVQPLPQAAKDAMKAIAAYIQTL